MYYGQVHRAAIRSPISPMVANLFMEESETKVIYTATKPPKLWRRCVVFTFVIKKTEHGTQFLQHIKSIPSDTVHYRGTQSIPFLDTFVTPGPDNTLLITVYRKPIHTDQYLHWDSYHNLSAKYSVFNTHTQRNVCVN